jgi:B-box zinc finger
MCKTHPSRLIQYFCSQCHEPVCIDCTIMGSHAKSEEGKHALVSVEEYFKTVLEESKMPNPPLIERRNAINDQISNIQSRADAVVDMGKQITSKIEEICARAKKECNDIVLKKVRPLGNPTFI